MPDEKKTLKIFKYIDELDCFIVTDEYKKIAEHLGLSEWNPVVWIGRLFILDNDYGEHWFDNWDLREERKTGAERFGLNYEELLIIDPDRFKNDADGPCHSPEMRKRFWTDVLKSLELSYDLLFEEARRFNNKANKKFFPEEFVNDLEERIEKIRKEF
ncbi:hypothetical protein QUF72_07835 [Desulfobacterales bacterium HSG2]|nr:hypothetical protein [Desulfobacterales bacterium HSG2]